MIDSFKSFIIASMNEGRSFDCLFSKAANEGIFIIACIDS